MNDYINISEQPEWLARELQRNYFLRFSQLACRTEKELLDSGIAMGTVRHIYLLLREHGLNFKDGDNCLCSLGLHKTNLINLRENFIDTLDDLERYSAVELEYELGFKRSTVDYIEFAMRRAGRSLA